MDIRNKRIITVATTGAWPKKSDNPNVPIEPAEIAEEIYQCWRVGAAASPFMSTRYSSTNRR